MCGSSAGRKGWKEVRRIEKGSFCHLQRGISQGFQRWKQRNLRIPVGTRECIGFQIQALPAHTSFHSPLQLANTAFVRRERVDGVMDAPTFPHPDRELGCAACTGKISGISRVA